MSSTESNNISALPLRLISVNEKVNGNVVLNPQLLAIGLLASLFSSSLAFSALEEEEAIYPTNLLKRVSLSQAVGTEAGIASMTDYTSLALLFAPDFWIGEVLPMVNLRGFRFSDNTFAGSFGVAARYLPTSICEVIGLNAYYDVREESGGPFHQLGLGAEVLSKRWDLRINGYLPLGPGRNVSTCVFDDYIGDYFIFRRRTKFSYYGFNAEAGWLAIQSKNFLLYCATGPYYFSGKVKQEVPGWLLRVRPQFNDYVALDLRVSFDPIFHTVFQAQLFFTIPLYRLGSHGSRTGPCGMTERQIYQPVERFEVIPTSRRCCWGANF